MFHDNQSVDMYLKEWAESFQCNYEIEVWCIKQTCQVLDKLRQPG